MPVGSGLPRLDGYPFEVRHSAGARDRARAAAELAADAYAYFSERLSGVRPDIALIIVDRADWPSRTAPYGLPFFRDDAARELRPGILVMPAGPGDFWPGMVEDLRAAAPDEHPKLIATYPDGAGGVDLRPFFDLVTIHELGHAFEVLGDLRLPTSWLSEIFVNLALHTFVATVRPDRLPTLEVLPTVGAGSPSLDARIRAEGYSTLEQLEAHYTGGENPMAPLNYVWFQHRWLRLAARIFAADGEAALMRFWECFHATDRTAGASPRDDGTLTAASLAPLLSAEVSQTLGRAVAAWR